MSALACAALLVPFNLAPVEFPSISLSALPGQPLGICVSAPTAPDVAASLKVRRLHKWIAPGRPFEFDVAPPSPCKDATAQAAFIAKLQTHFSVSAVPCDRGGRPRGPPMPAALSQSDSGCLRVRVMVGADAICGMIVSATYAGMPACASHLPVTTTVFRALAPKGAVWLAAVAGDVAKLKAALARGGSTEEADEVWAYVHCRGACFGHVFSPLHTFSQDGYTALLAVLRLHDLRTLGDTRYRSATSVSIAADAAKEARYVAVTRLLLEGGADITRRPLTVSQVCHSRTYWGAHLRGSTLSLALA